MPRGRIRVNSGEFRFVERSMMAERIPNEEDGNVPSKTRSKWERVLIAALLTGALLAGPALGGPPPPPPGRDAPPPPATRVPPPPVFLPAPVVVNPLPVRSGPPPLPVAMRVIYAPFYVAGLIIRYSVYYVLVAPFEVLFRTIDYGATGGVDPNPDPHRRP